MNPGFQAKLPELVLLLQWPFEVVSAIGSIGSADDEQGNGATNEAAVAAAAKAGVKRFVLVSASKDRSMCLCSKIVPV